MNLNIKATGMSLTPAIEADVKEKLKNIESFLHSEDQVHVELAVEDRKSEGKVFRAEVSISPDGNYAESEGSTLYEAVDLVVPKIRQQLTKRKDKSVSLRRKFGQWKDKFFGSAD